VGGKRERALVVVKYKRGKGNLGSCGCSWLKFDYLVGRKYCKKSSVIYLVEVDVKFPYLAKRALELEPATAGNGGVFGAGG